MPGANNSNPGTDSELLDLSSTDVEWTVNLAPRELFVEGAGDVKFVGIGGRTDTWTVPANSRIPISVKKVFKLGTTALRIHAIY